MNDKLVIFDLDGTLADTLPWFREALGGVARRFGFHAPSAEEFETLRGADNRAVLRALRVPAWKLPLIAAHMRRRAASDIHRIPLFDGAPRVLRGLRDAGFQLALVTSNSEANARRVLGPELAPLFFHYACGASLFGKASKFRKAVRAAGVAPTQVIAIGDEMRDIEAARAIGVRAGAVAWGFANAQALEAHGPDVMFEAMDDILRWAERGAFDETHRLGAGASVAL